MLKRILILVGMLVIFLLIFDAVFQHQSAKMEVVLGGKKFLMDIVGTPALQEQGLSGRTTLADGAGMIFIFPQPGNHGFWMKDMLFPLDIIWISSDHKIVHMEKNLTPQTYPTVYYPDAPTKFVLEISAGQADKLNVKIDDAVNFTK